MKTCDLAAEYVVYRDADVLRLGDLERDAPGGGDGVGVNGAQSVRLRLAVRAWRDIDRDV